MRSGEVAGCSNEFKSLLSAPTPGALQLKKHLVQGGQSGTQPGHMPVFYCSSYEVIHCLLLIGGPITVSTFFIGFVSFSRSNP